MNPNYEINCINLYINGKLCNFEIKCYIITYIYIYILFRCSVSIYNIFSTNLVHTHIIIYIKYRNMEIIVISE